jgi:hypothetical protein
MEYLLHGSYHAEPEPANPQELKQFFSHAQVLFSVLRSRTQEDHLRAGYPLGERVINSLRQAVCLAEQAAA